MKTNKKIADIQNKLLNSVKAGNLNQLNNTLCNVAPQEREKLIHNDNDIAFREAVIRGHLIILERLLELTPEEPYRSMMIHARDNEAFREAAKDRRFSIIERLLDMTPVGVRMDQMIHARDDELFIMAAEAGHLALIERLLQLTTDENKKAQMLHARNDQPFRWAAVNGHLTVIERLLELTPDAAQRRAMVLADDFLSFIWAALNNRLTILNKLLELEEEELKARIKPELLSYVAENGHVSTINWLLELIPESEKVQMIFSTEDGKLFPEEIVWSKLFLWAVDGRHLTIIDKLIKLAPPIENSNLSGVGHRVFTTIAERGQLSILNRILNLIVDEHQRNRILHGNEDAIFRAALMSGDLFMVKGLLELTPDRRQRDKMIHARDDETFILAAQGSLSLLDKLLGIIPDQNQRRQIIRNNDYAVFRAAVKGGNVFIVERLLGLMPDDNERRKMVSAKNNEAFILTAERGSLSVLDKLLEVIPDQNQRRQIIRNNDELFTSAVRSGNVFMVEKLLGWIPDDDERREMICREDNRAFKIVIFQGYINIIAKLLESISDDIQRSQIIYIICINAAKYEFGNDMIKAGGYDWRYYSDYPPSEGSEEGEYVSTPQDRNNNKCLVYLLCNISSEARRREILNKALAEFLSEANPNTRTDLQDKRDLLLARTALVLNKMANEQLSFQQLLYLADFVHLVATSKNVLSSLNINEFIARDIALFVVGPLEEVIMAILSSLWQPSTLIEGEITIIQAAEHNVPGLSEREGQLAR